MADTDFTTLQSLYADDLKKHQLKVNKTSLSEKTKNKADQQTEHPDLRLYLTGGLYLYYTTRAITADNKNTNNPNFLSGQRT